MVELLLATYFLSLGALAVLGVHRVRLTRAAVAARRRPPAVAPKPETWPGLLVQLPVYNEALVVERLLGSVSALRYPGALEIQVLDDSTDLTTGIVAREVERLRGLGVSIAHVRRVDRRGYKAGALARGLEESTAELVALFDADFTPSADFLERVVPALLADERLGMVQARWAHENRTQSWLTRAQAVFLDAHFGIEHRARAFLGLFFNFNGTAGVWRRRAIDEAGGWSSDTLTEDLDLSYRAQLVGWRFTYLDELEVPAELPESWTAFRTQQFRWVRGGIETWRKLMPQIWRTPGVSIAQRLEATMHLSGNFAYFLMALLAALLPLAVVARDQLGWLVPGGQWLLSVLDYSMLTAGTLAMVVFYVASMRARPVSERSLFDIAFALCLGAGMSLGNARQVLLGLRGARSEFSRTPKRGGSRSKTALQLYRAHPERRLIALELLFLAYYSWALVYAASETLLAAIPFLALYWVGFAAVGLGSIADALRSAETGHFFKRSRFKISVT